MKPIQPTPFERPLRRFRTGVLLGMSVLLLGFWRLQVIQHSYYLGLADLNRVQVVRLHPPRGVIVDRHQQVLADTGVTSVLVWEPRRPQADPRRVFPELFQVLGWPETQRASLMPRVQRLSAYYPERLNWALNTVDIARFEFYRERFPDLVLQTRPSRSYPYGPITAHVLGYVGWIGPEDRAQPLYADYPGDAVVGKTGIERYYEPALRGEFGQAYYVVNSLNIPVQELKAHRRSPRPGNRLVLAVDLDLQRIAYEVLQDVSAAFVALDPRTGAVRAMVSTPSFDPNEFVPYIRPERWKDLLEDPARPLQNRAIQALYPPGSTFKVVMTVAGLLEGWTTPTQTVTCPGYARLYNHVFRCWKPTGHGTVDLHAAIVHSCDVYFYHLGARAPIDTVARYAAAFGYGVPTGIDLYFEKGGLVPTTFWKERVRGEPWYPGETVSVAIGQGPLLATPLQQANVMAMIWNRGVQYQPYVVQAIESPDGRVVLRREPRVINRLRAPEAVWDFLRKTVCEVVQAGTGRAARDPDVPICGKTGTVELLSDAEKVPPELLEKYKTHAWFVGWVDWPDDPMAFALIVEHSGHGGEVAAPRVREIFRRYGALRRPPPSASPLRSRSHAALPMDGF
jgi:penicillin-binding protein 2